MAFEEIACVNAKPVARLDAVPTDGVRVRAQALTTKKRGTVRFIRVAIGGGLARKLSLTLPQQKLRVLFGSGEDAGKIMIAPDQEKGAFLAKRDKVGRYSLTVNAASAEGLFALEFPAFAVLVPEVQRAPNCPPAVVFSVSAEMLAADD